MASDAGINEWLERHHRVEAPSTQTNGEEIHVFANEIGQVFGEPSTEKSYAVSFNLGPLLTTRYISVHHATGQTLVCYFANYPFLPQFTMGYACGNIKEGLQVKSEGNGVHGRIDVYVQDGWSCERFDLTFLGKHYQADIKLIPLKL